MHAHEPQVSERLSKMVNVTLTSHTGGGSVETAMGFETLVMKNVDAVLEGRAALTAVNQGLVDGYVSSRNQTNGGANGHDDVDGVMNVNGESMSTNGEPTNGVMIEAGTGKVNESASTAVGNT